MKCAYCSAEIPNNSYKCPYCKQDILSSKKLKQKVDNDLIDRFYQIDRLYGFDVDFVALSTNKLEEYWNKIEQQYEKDRQQNAFNIQQLTKINDKISQIDEELQNRYPLRNIVDNNENCSNINNVVIKMLSFSPPEVYGAAFKIRASIERKLRDFYNFPYVSKSLFGENCGFVKTYQQMFNEVTGDVNLSFKLCKTRSMLNRFVHESKLNDEEIRRSFPDLNSQVEFLIRALNLFRKCNLL